VKTALATCALLAGATLAPLAQAQVPIPKFEALVTDLTGTLTAAQQSALDEKLTAFQARKGAQVALLIIPTTEPEDIAQFGPRLAEAWKTGRKDIDDGAILIVAKDDRALRIEVQYGLEGTLTDATSNRIINDTIVPLFKQGDLYAGVNAGLDQMIKVIDGEALPAPDPQWNPGEGRRTPLLYLLFIGFMFLNNLRSVLGRGPVAILAGLAGGGIVWWLTSRLLWAGGAGIGAFLLALLVNFGGGGLGGGRGGRVFRDIGGGFGGFGGRGGGGFGGGLGGRGGGGGASGRW